MQWLLLSEHNAQTSPGTTRFFLSIHLPHLSCMIPCSYWGSTCVAAFPSCITFYEISLRQTRDLPVVILFPHPASFRFHLTMDTLAFGYILPTTRRIRDFNPLETCAAGRTTKQGMSHMPCFLLLYPAFVYSSDSVLHILGCHLFVICLNICRQVLQLSHFISQRSLFL